MRAYISHTHYHIAFVSEVATVRVVQCLCVARGWDHDPVSSSEGAALLCMPQRIFFILWPLNEP